MIVGSGFGGSVAALRLTEKGYRVAVIEAGRRFEDKCAEMYYRGKMFGFVHLYNGQEAVSTGVIKAMKMQHAVNATAPSGYTTSIK